jgi:hypothetical protein
MRIEVGLDDVVGKRPQQRNGPALIKPLGQAFEIIETAEAGIID